MTTGNNTAKLAKNDVIRKFPPWKAFYLSFYSPEIYQDAARSWKGLGFQYLVLLLVGLWTVASLNVHFIVTSYVDGYLIPLVEQLPPEVMIKDGVMTMKSKSDVLLVKDPRDGRVVVTFDLRPQASAAPDSASGSTAANALPAPGTPSADGIFVFRNRMELRSKNQFQDIEFKSSWESPFKSITMLDYLKRMRNWVAPTVLAVFWLASFVLCAIQALIYGLIGKLIALMNKCPLTYQQIVRISVVALTPVLIVDTLQKLAGRGLPVWTLVSILIVLLYVFYGVKANSIRATLEWNQESSKTQ